MLKYIVREVGKICSDVKRHTHNDYCVEAFDSTNGLVRRIKSKNYDVGK